MRKLKCVVLPLFLCAAVLLAGFFTPELYRRGMPDKMGEVQTVSLADAKNPMYIADGADIVLPPWDVVDETATKRYVEQEDREALGMPSVNNLISMWISHVNDAAFPAGDVNFEAALYVDNTHSDQGLSFAFLRDFRYFGVDGTPYTLDLVLLNGYLTLYLSVHAAGEETEPYPHTAALTLSFESMRWMAKDFTQGGDWNLTEEELLKNSYEAGRTEWQFLHFFLAASKQNYTESEDGEFLFYDSTSDYFWNILNEFGQYYTVSYADSMTLLVCPDGNNLPLTFLCDGKSETLLGFSISPEAFGFSPFPTSAPTYAPAADSSESVARP